MIKEDVKFQKSCVFEGMTSIRAVLRANDLKISDRKIIDIIYDVHKKDKIVKELRYLRAVSDKYGFFVKESNTEYLQNITLGNTHGGIVAICSERTIPSLNSETQIDGKGFYAMIEGIEDPYNFGYALRSLYACGASGIILTERNWMSAAGVVCRSSAGASELFPILKSEPKYCIEYFKINNYTVVCADENTDNILGKCDIKKPLLLIVGGEKRGISSSLLEMCDLKVKIDYARDFKSSLSAASAATIFAYEIMRQN